MGQCAYFNMLRIEGKNICGLLGVVSEQSDGIQVIIIDNDAIEQWMLHWGL